MQTERPSDRDRIANAMQALEEATAETADYSLPETAKEASGEIEVEEPKNEEVSAKEPKTEEEPTSEPEPEGIAVKLAAIAKREKMQREEHRSRVEELEAREKALADKMTKYEVFEQAKQRAISDPVAFFKTLGIEKGFADMAAQLWHHELGDDAPEEFKKQQQYRSLEAKLLEQERKYEELIKQQEARVQQIEQARQAQEYQGRISSYLASMGDSHPHLRAHVEADTDDARQAMVQVAVAMLEQDPNHIPDPRELAEFLEERIQQQMARYGSLYERKKNGTDEREDEARSIKTLSNRSTSSQTRKREPALTESERKRRAVQALGDW